MNRRHFLKAAATSAIAGATVPAMSRTAAGPEDKLAFEDLPKIDIHVHFFEDTPGLAETLRSLNMQVVSICVRGNNPRSLQMMQDMSELLDGKYHDVFRYASTFDLTQRNAADYHRQVTDWLDKSYAAGAVMTKIWKEVGMEFKTPSGNWLMPDDPVFDPIYTHLIQSGVPLLAHLAEPIDAWRPLEPNSAHKGYYSKHPEWHFYNKPGKPQWDEIIAARDNILQKFPDLTVIGAHMGSMSYDVSQVALRLDRYDNFFVEAGGRTIELAWQDHRKVRNFFIQYQDRVMYGSDVSRFPRRGGPVPRDTQQAWLNSIEQRWRQDYRFYAGSGTMNYGGREVECLDLPVDVLRKFFADNARRVVPGLRE